MPPLPEAFAQRGTVGEVASQAALFRQVLDFFTALAESRSILLLLDDLHWADPASLDLLRFFARSIASMSVLIVATYRVDALTRKHPLYMLLPTLVREASATRIDLQHLEPNDIHLLVTNRYALPEADRQRLVAYLHARSEGNPFFLDALLHTLEAERVMEATASGWAVGDLSRVRIPILLRQVIDGRLARLGEEGQQLLAMAAVIGQAVPLDVWMAVTGTNEETLTWTAERAIAAHVLETLPDSEHVRFRHALIREALYEGTVPMLRRTWHRRAGDTLTALPHPDPDAVAYHFQQAGDKRASEWLIQAGERAHRAYAWLTAAARFEAALALMGEGDGERDARGWLLVRLAEMWRYADPRKALSYLDESARIAAAEGDRALAAATEHDWGLFRIFLHEAAEGLPRLASGVAAIEALSTAERARLDGHVRGFANAHGTLMMHLSGMGYLAETFAVAERSEIEPSSSAHEGVYGGSGLADRYAALGLAHALRGDPEDAQRAFVLARETYRSVEHHMLVGWTSVTQLYAVTLPYHTDRIEDRRRLVGGGEQAWQRASSGTLTESYYPQLARLYLSYLILQRHLASKCGILPAIGAGGYHDDERGDH
jgi:hypothetical protein